VRFLLSLFLSDLALVIQCTTLWCIFDKKIYVCLAIYAWLFHDRMTTSMIIIAQSWSNQNWGEISHRQGLPCWLQLSRTPWSMIYFSFMIYSFSKYVHLRMIFLCHCGVSTGSILVRLLDYFQISQNQRVPKMKLCIETEQFACSNITVFNVCISFKKNVCIKVVSYWMVCRN